MDNISNAATTIDIVTYAFQFAFHLHYFQSSEETEEQINANFGGLISSLTTLSTMLRGLEAQFLNPMLPLPLELEAAVTSCASDLARLEDYFRLLQVESRSRLRPKMELQHKDVQELRTMVQTQINLLGPHLIPEPNTPDETNNIPKWTTQALKSSFGGNSVLAYHETIYTLSESYDQSSCSRLNTKSTPVANQGTGVTECLSVVTEKLRTGHISYSKRQLHELLCVLKELYGRDEAGTSEGSVGIQACLRRYSNIKDISFDENPSVEAYGVIVALKLQLGDRKKDGQRGTVRLTIGTFTLRDIESQRQECLQQSHTSFPETRSTTIFAMVQPQPFAGAWRNGVSQPRITRVKDSARKSTGGTFRSSGGKSPRKQLVVTKARVLPRRHAAGSSAS